MTWATHEVADVIHRFGDELLRSGMVTPARRRVMRALVACRTSALGGHVEACDSCDYRRISYNSCRNRHCPKCQGSRQAQWLEDRAKDLLPVEYFHVVFTVPAEPRGTGQNRPVGVTSKPASCESRTTVM